MISDYTQALSCGVEAWSEFWGDPLFSGSLMMATYALAAVMAARVAARLAGAERLAWRLAAVLLAFQVINTPLDLHGLLWASGRCLARIQGWYAERHLYQRELLVMLAVTGCAVTGAAILVLRHDLVANALLVAGLGLALGMTVVKGVNYHHLEALYGARVGPLRVPDLIELAGIACVFLAVFLKRRRLGSKPL
jgi:hypothetical protein